MADSPNQVLELDGSILEGGGQVIRNSIALAALLNQPITIENVRAGRDTPGLRPQHLTGIQLVNTISAGDLDNDHVGSRSLSFTPGPWAYLTQYAASTNTAGSICLLVQVALPCLLFQAEKCETRLQGGTNAQKAPPIDYAQLIFQPFMEKHFGAHFSLNCERRGWYPRGGGVVRLFTEPMKSLRSIKVTDRGEIEIVRGVIVISGKIPTESAELIHNSAKKVLRKELRQIPIEIEIDEDSGRSNGLAVILYAETSTGCRLAGSQICERKMSPEQCGEMAANDLLANIQHGGCVDEHLSDQIIIYMALAEGRSTVRCGPLSSHTRTAIHFAEKITDFVGKQKGQNGARFNVSKCEDGSDSYSIECDGIGFISETL
eukprot:1000203_1